MADSAFVNGGHLDGESATHNEKLNVVVVGAGIGGLLAGIGLQTDGNFVTILDQASSFVEVGAGMHIPPNSSQLLDRWGLDLTSVKKTYSNGNRFLRYDTGEVLANMPHGIPECGFVGSYLMVHRADYHAMLLEKALSLGIDVRSSSKVESYDWELPSAILEDGDEVEGDLLVIADGAQSSARGAFQGYASSPVDTGYISYRALVPGQDILADPEMRSLISQSWITSWCGPGAHVIGYPVRGGELYNVVLCASESTQNDHEMTKGDSKLISADEDELVRRFSGWEPQVRKLAALAAKDFLKWRLYDPEFVDNWVHPSGNAVLLGDAAHPMLPHMASGAAMASEDAAVLRKVLQSSSKATLTSALEEYERIRRPRTLVLQKWGRRLQDSYHLPDGETRKEHDECIAKNDDASPVYWGHDERRKWLFSHDAETF